MSQITTLNLPYTYKIDPKVTKNSIQTYYETSIGLWRNHLNETSGESYNIIDNLFILHQKCNEINSTSSKNNQVTIISPSMQNQLISIIINGDDKYRQNVKTQILSEYISICSKTIVIDQSEFLLIGEKFINEMNKLCNKYQVEVIINNDKSSFDLKQCNQKDYSIHMIGNQDNVTIFETSLKILIDSLLSNYKIDSIYIPLSLIPLIGGQDLINFKEIAKQTNCNIYIPDLLSNLSSSENNLDIYLTSKNTLDLIMTKSIIKNLINNNLQLISKSINMNLIKIELLNLNNQKDIINLMLKYGTFIEIPNLKNLNNTNIIVQGDNIESIDDCISELCSITSQYYTVSGISNHQNEIIQMCQYIKNCNVNINDTHFTVVGHNKEIKSLINKFARISTSLNIQLELTNDQKEFISGKKNGKLIKILNQLNNIPSIYFTPYNEYSFNIDINSSSTFIIPQAIELIEMELPSELKFNIPEVFHKSIIGNGGSMIQSIMKKYNVFIKFSTVSNNSLKPSFSFQRPFNVLIKCPRKNTSNIKLVKIEIDNLVSKYCINEVLQQNVTLYYNIKFQILKNQYLLLMNNKNLNLISELENEYNSFIDFPNSIDKFKNSNVLEFNIKGSELRIKNCAKALKSILPQCFEFKIEFNLFKFKQYLSSQVNENENEFKNQILIPFKLLLGFDLIINEYPIDSTTNSSYHQIILSYYDSEPISKLNNAIESLTYWLNLKGFTIIEKSSYNFNSILNTSLSSPIKINNFTTTNTTSSNMPLQMITNLNGSPIKNFNNNNYNNNSGPLSPIKNFNIVSPSRQQLMMSTSPIKYNNTINNYSQPSSPIKNNSYIASPSLSSSPIKQNFYNSSPQRTVDQSLLASPFKYQQQYQHQKQQSNFLNSSPVQLKPFDYGSNNYIYNI
ncbi:uncharacterized protein KGF55_000418 [Candida pseudojiufengensis]|uniref:uncharacterized protein n=1 Tax=Candida pseudojiufengensis TaxID=497109 RepID=UPI002224DD66|nr:uncharacterized protein KGF55_000418 [Candida pseudojiufengensis]KAI5967008.1 hypothetical protein KGF55_000418 [Candida pseudojiufengensis]